ncbi:transcriptional repressor [Bosea minatitlanensis]
MLFVPPETRSRLEAERNRARMSPAGACAILKQAGLRPTRQRIALGTLLFGEGHRHLTADDLHLEAIDEGISLSLATVYNTLSQFDEAGLIRRVSVSGGKAYYDTDTGDHHHFYIEAEDRIIDIEPGRISVGGLPAPPAGYEITKVDVVVRLRRIGTGP